MKTGKILIGLLAGALLLTGCAKQEIPEDNSDADSIYSEISDPMNVPEENNSHKVPSITYGAEFNAERVSLSDGKLVVKPKLMGGSSDTHIGIMIFVDGVLQKYSVENSDENNFMSMFDIKAESEKEYSLNVSAKVDDELDNHYISMATMLAPEYTATADNPNFGFYHKILGLMSISAPNEIKTVLSSEKHEILKAENSVLTQKQREKFGLDDEMFQQNSTTQFNLLQSDNPLEMKYVLPAGKNKLKLNFSALSTVSKVQDFRIMFFVNHEPVKFNGTKEYLDTTVEGDKITEQEIEIDDVKIGDFVYCIAVPLASNENTFKSESKLIVGENDQSLTSGKQNSETVSSNDSSSSDTENTDNSSVSNISNNSKPTVPNTNANVSTGEFDNVKLSGKIIPRFAIGEDLYADSEDGLCIIDLNGNVIKKSPNGSNFNIKGDKISMMWDNSSDISASQNGALTFIEPADKTITLNLLDKEFNEIKSVTITDNIGQCYSFDEMTIAYITENSEEIRTLGWDFNNPKTLMTLSSGARFNSIVLGNGFIAFTYTDNSGTNYGICDLNGNVKEYGKDGITSAIQVIGGTALWRDEHVDTSSGQIPSGEVVLYRNGKFETVKTENAIESQNVFLIGENEFITAMLDSGVLRQYKNGVKTGETSLEEGEYVFSAARVGNKIVVGTALGSDYRLRIWEID